MINENLNNIEAQASENNTDSINIHDIIQIFVNNWYWFILSVIICCIAGYLNIKITPKVYNRTATILVKDSRKGGDSELAAFSDLAGFQSRRNVDNELFIVQSRRLMTDVVKRLGLTVNYSTEDRFMTQDLYGRSPIDIQFIDDNDKQGFSFSATPYTETSIKLSEFDYKDIDSSVANSVVTAQYGDTISSPVGLMVINKTPYMSEKNTNNSIIVNKRGLASVTNYYRNAVKSSVSGEKTSVIVMSMNDVVPKRAEDVINTLVEVYNNDAIDEKRRVSLVSGEFIRNRLAIIANELNNADKDIETFKRDNKMYDIVAEAQSNMMQSSKYKNEGLSVDNQIRMAEFIKDYLMDVSKSKEMIPVSASDITNSAVSSQISKYNDAILQRDRLSKNSTDNNPTIRELDYSLSAIRRSIIASLDNHIATLNIQLKTLRQEEARANKNIISASVQENEILGITRQRKIKEELYLYLLNKQEENELSAVVAESNSRLIDAAFGSAIPVAPKSMMIMGIAFLLGLGIPFGYIYIKMMLDTSVHGRKDVTSVITATFLGDIPIYTGSIVNGIAIKDMDRTPLSEAFRILRSNMSFLHIDDKPMQVIMVTSTNPHAGKTFVSMNLGVTLALAGNKVAIIDLDLRNRTLSKQLGSGHNTNGITAYMSGKINDIKSMTQTIENSSGLDFICSGIEPPNPTEMLLSKRLNDLFTELRAMYDYIIVDTTPSMAVADAMIVDRLNDLSIYVIRDGVLDRRQLADIERLHREKKFHNMSIVLNGTKIGNNGYGYGYGYKYGYGYGKESIDAQRQTVIKRVKKMLGKNNN